jgi:hypothetical protein
VKSREWGLAGDEVARRLGGASPRRDHHDPVVGRREHLGTDVQRLGLEIGYDRLAHPQQQAGGALRIGTHLPHP